MKYVHVNNCFDLWPDSFVTVIAGAERHDFWKGGSYVFRCEGSLYCFYLIFRKYEIIIGYLKTGGGGGGGRGGGSSEK